jgi:tetratricopeptide (TPR) repeat protein
MQIKKLKILMTIILSILISTNYVKAQTNDISSQVTLANKFYHEKNYPAAAIIFEEIISQGEINGYLYYNLGNTYMRLGNTGKAILNYLQAQLLLPRNESLDANLRYAINQTQDKLSPPTNGLITGILFWIDSISLIEHFEVLILFNFIFWCICIASLYYRKSPWRSLKKISITILLVIFFSTGVKYHLLSKQTIGVIIDKKVAVKSDRNPQNITLFELHEGAIISVGQEDGKWIHITVDTDKSGWVPKRSISF